MRNSARTVAYTLSRVLNTIGMSIVGVLVIYILLTLLQANPDNTAARLVRELAQFFDLGLSNLFLLDDPRWSVALNFGVAALVWMAGTAVLVRLVRRMG